MRKPARPPRRSRKAKRRVGARLGRAMSPVAGAFTPFSLRKKVAATPFSLGEKVAGEARRMRVRPKLLAHGACKPSPPTPLPLERGALRRLTVEA